MNLLLSGAAFPERMYIHKEIATMKVFPLSDKKERTAGIAFSAVMCVCLLVLLYALRTETTLFLMMLLASVLIIFFLGLYVLNVTKSACVYHPERKELEVRGLRSYTLDLSNAAQLETIAIRNGQVTSRLLVFTDEEGQIVAKLPNMFTSRQGLLAELFAKDFAAELGIRFKANIPEWEYNEEARKEHEKQVALEQKEERKQRAAARRAWLIQKYKNKK